MNREQLKIIANKMVEKGKGILAADESTPTCKKRFNAINVESTDLSRNVYRDLLFTTPYMNSHISGVILFDETFKQNTIKKDLSIPEYLQSIDVLPGIKVDAGAKNLANHNNEKITEGLDGLRDRLVEYYKNGARFAKWRAVIRIGDGIPTEMCIHVNAHALARYASLCQESGIVPIVEPEVLMDGDHTIEKCYEVSKKTLIEVFNQLVIQGVYLEGIVLKPNMIISGKDCIDQANPEKVASLTVECLKETVPSEVPGIAFLSGGQSNEEATIHLNLINKDYGNDLPWNLTFSYGRALQQSALLTWAGEDNNITAAQSVFYQRAKFNSLATVGKFSEEMETILT